MKKTIWIDLDNTPHVPFFRPIIRELEKRGYGVKTTARDAFQVYELAEFLGVKHKRVGHHYGKSKFMKVAGSLVRAGQLAVHVRREKPVLAVSHGSRSQVVAAHLLGVPSVLIYDYEFSKALSSIHPNLIMVPEIIPDDAIPYPNVYKYGGLKEDVYAPDFLPDPAIKSELGISEQSVVVTLRPPATEAHYHIHKSQRLYEQVVEYLASKPDVQVVLVPRNKRQEEFAAERWPRLLENKRVIIPAQAVDGLNLIWFSDLVISGGGTMNREAAALGVPVYSIFQSKIGAVDKYLAESGRLVFLENAEDLEKKVVLARRDKAQNPLANSNTVLMEIVHKIIEAAETTG